MSLTKEHKRAISKSVKETLRKKKEELALQSSSSASNHVVLANKNASTSKEVGDMISLAMTRDVYKHTFLNLTLDTIRAVLNSTETGQLLDWIEFADSMIESDPHLKGLVSNRKSSLSSREILVLPASEEERDIQAAFFIEERLKEIGNLNASLNTLQQGIFYGLGACELMWNYKKTNGAGYYFVSSLEPIPAKRFEIAEINEQWKYVLSDYGRFPMNEENPLLKYPYKFILHSPDDNELPHFRGLLRSLAFIYYFKKIGLVYWVGGAEKHAFPPIFALFPPNTKAEAVNKLVTNLYQMSNDGVAAFENTVKVEQLQSKATDGSTVYKDLLAYCDTAMTKLILGGTLVVEAASGPGGNRALGEVHERSKETIMKSDANNLAQTLQRSLVQPLLEKNRHLFGNVVPNTPIIKFNLEAEKPIEITQMHLQAGAVTVNELRKATGLPPAPKEWGEQRASLSYQPSPVQTPVVPVNDQANDEANNEANGEDAQSPANTEQTSQTTDLTDETPNVENTEENE